MQDYQKQFERLGNRVQGWTQKALVGTFMGGLIPEIADAIRMFKPQNLKDAIGYARMKDQQLQRQRKVYKPPNHVFWRPLQPPGRSQTRLPNACHGKKCRSEGHGVYVLIVTNDSPQAIDVRHRKSCYWQQRTRAVMIGEMKAMSLRKRCRRSCCMHCRAVQSTKP